MPSSEGKTRPGSTEAPQQASSAGTQAYIPPAAEATPAATAAEPAYLSPPPAWTESPSPAPAASTAEPSPAAEAAPPAESPLPTEQPASAESRASGTEAARPAASPSPRRTSPLGLVLRGGSPSPERMRRLAEGPTRNLDKYPVFSVLWPFRRVQMVTAQGMNCRLTVGDLLYEFP